jgi:two-component system, NtrC family, response regulator AtoC
MATVKTLMLSSCEASPPEHDSLAEELSEGFVFPINSPSAAKVRASIEQVAHVDLPVLLLGESGVGKEVAARWIHRLSRRAHRSLRIVNCAALPAELLESELFGYEAGAFTGATRSKPGHFELCNKGTLLLDEIGELPPSLQAKLLHVLQGGQFSRLGGRSLIEVDVRILAATNVNVPQALATKQLREDLYYRLSALAIHLPPLRERPEQIPIFLEYFMDRSAAQLGRAPKTFSPTLLDACLSYRWPGNVRELENFVKRYLILGDEHLPLANHAALARPQMPSALNRSSRTRRPGDRSLRAVKAEAERGAILQALEESKWRRKDAAQRLCISMKALYNKLKMYGIGAQDDPDDLIVNPPADETELPCRRVT